MVEHSNVIVSAMTTEDESRRRGGNCQLQRCRWRTEWSSVIHCERFAETHFSIYTHLDSNYTYDESARTDHVMCPSIGDIVMVSPDQAGRESDKALGFKLGLNLGMVKEILEDDIVRVHWFYSSSPTWAGSEWILWINPADNLPYEDTLAADTLLTTSYGNVARVVMESSPRSRGPGRWRITRDSLKDVVDDVKNQSGGSAFEDRNE